MAKASDNTDTETDTATYRTQKGHGHRHRQTAWCVDSLHFVSQAPEDSTKDEADSQGQEEAGAIVLRHAPVDGHVLGEDGRELHGQRLWELVLELQLLAALLGTAVLLQQTSIVPVWPFTTYEAVRAQNAAHMNWCTCIWVRT